MPMNGSVLPGAGLRPGLPAPPADAPAAAVSAAQRWPQVVTPKITSPILTIITCAALALGLLAWLAITDARAGLEALVRTGQLHVARYALDALDPALQAAEAAPPAQSGLALTAGQAAWRLGRHALAAVVQDGHADTALHRDYLELEQHVLARLASLGPAVAGTPPVRLDAGIPGRAEHYRLLGERLRTQIDAELRQLSEAAHARLARTALVAFGLGGALMAATLHALLATRRQLGAWQHRICDLEYEATHDPLTQLPNRRFFVHCAGYGLAQALRDRRPAGVLLLDLDGFKAVNDRYGHAAGDRLLVEIATRLQLALRESDLLARLGGDEFAILTTTAGTPDELEHFATRLLTTLHTPQPDAAGEVPVSASIGIAHLPGHGHDIHALLKAADTAMYEAKRSGGHAFRHANSVAGCFAEARTPAHVRSASS